jgi:hypothetical protein
VSSSSAVNTSIRARLGILYVCVLIFFTYILSAGLHYSCGE